MSQLQRTLILDAPAERLDRVLAAGWPDLSRSRIQALIRDGRVSLDGVVVTDPAGRAPAGSAAVLEEPPPVDARPAPEAIGLRVLYEDEALIVIDKPAGLVVHPGAGHETGTLVNALLAHCGDSLSGIGGVRRPGIVHRLDRDTSGLLVVAKTDAAHRALSAQFADHGRTGPLRRAYGALVWGVPEPARGTVRAALARSASHREKIAIVSDGQGRHAVTHYKMEEVLAGGVAALVRCELETGRTHQIRVHLAHLRHPVIGDPTYGLGFRTKAAALPPAARRLADGLGRQALHAGLPEFEHPTTGEVVRFESPPPADFAALISALRDG